MDVVKQDASAWSRCSTGFAAASLPSRTAGSSASNTNGFGRSLQPSYDISNLRLGVKGPNEVWTAEAYITNMFDKNAIIYTNTANYDHRNTTNEPRVIGLRLSYRWGKGE